MSRFALRLAVMFAAVALTSLVQAEDRWQLVHAGSLLDLPGKAPRGASTLVLRNDRVESVHEGHVAAATLPQVPDDAAIVDLKSYFFCRV